MKIFLVLVVLFLSSAVNEASAAAPQKAKDIVSKEKTSPYQLMWKGKMIPPQCIDRLNPMEGEPPKEINLKESCSVDAKFEIEKMNGKPDTIVETHNGDNAGYTAYQVYGKIPTGYVVSTLWNGGGTGHFSNLMVVDIKGDKLYVRDRISGGDRCNGGIANIRVEKETLIFNKYITPADFPDIAYGQDKGIKAYEDLEASAMSCFGEAVYHNNNLVSVTLNKDSLASYDEAWTAKYKYQKCFNQVFAAQADKKADLSKDEFKVFMDGFFKTCVKP